MAHPLSADRTAESLLWYYEEPRRYRAEGRRRDAPLLDSGVVLKLALGRRVDFVRAALNEARTIVTLRDAAGLYVRLVFFRPEATPYQILGLAQGASAESIKESFRLLMHLVHPDRQDARVVWPDSFAAQANRAYGILRNQDTRVQFDREAQARAAMARSIHRTAEASAASKMPVPLRPRPRFGKRGVGGVALPEWVTAGVGAFVREHPSATAFTALITVAALWVGMMVWESREEFVRDVDSVPEDASVASLAGLPKLAWLGAPEVSPTAPATVPASAGGSAKRSPLAEAKTLAVRITPEAQVPRAAGTPEPPVAATVSEPAAEVIPREPPAAIVNVEPVGPPLRQVASASAEPAPPPVAERAELTGTAVVAAVGPSAPATTEIETLFATFVESYERGRVDAFSELFDVDAEANLHRGRTAIRGEYDELFRLSQWRKMQLTRVNWKRVGNRALAKGEIVVRIGWRDGREVEQHLAMDMELVRRDGRVVIARMSQQPRN